MSMKTLSGKITLVFVVLVMICPAVPVRAADSDALLNMLPDNCVFCLRINNFNESLGKMDQYMAGASPIPMSLAMLANMQLGGVIGDPMLTGIDLDRDFAVFSLFPENKEKGPIRGILVPVNDYSEFIKTNPNCIKQENGTTLLSAPNSSSAYILLPAGNKYALATIDDTYVEPLKKAIEGESKLSKRLTPAQAKDAATAPAWMYVDLAGLYDKYNLMLNGAIQMLEQKVSAENTPAQMPQMKEMMSLYFKVLPEIVKELGDSTDSMTVALTPEPTILNLDLAFRAKDNSKLAGVFVQNPKADSSYTMTGYLDNSNAVNGLSRMHMGNYNEMYDLFFEPFEKVAEDSQFKDAMKKFRASLDKFNSAMGDEVACSFSYGGGMPPFKFIEVIDIKNPDLLKEYIQESMGFVNEMYKSMGIPAEVIYQQGVSTYKNAAIDTMSFSFSMPNNPNIEMGAGEKATLDNMKYYMARTPDKYYMVMGTDGENTLKKLIDQSATASAPSGDIKIAMDTLQGTPYKDFVCSVNVIKLMQGVSKMMQSIDVQSGTSPAAAMFGGLKNVSSQSCLVLGGKCADGEAAMRFAVPKQHLVEIIAAVMQMQQQTAQNSSTPTTARKSASCMPN